MCNFAEGLGDSTNCAIIFANFDQRVNTTRVVLALRAFTAAATTAQVQQISRNNFLLSDT